jgi:ubiquinone/menaquinone biosynthesis C-methylase UbiE
VNLPLQVLMEYDKTMRSEPYLRVSEQVKKVVRPLLHGGDEYHRGHEARLARTIQLIVDLNPKGRLLEIGTTGVIPYALKQLLPDLEVVVTHFDKSRPTDAKVQWTVNGEKFKLRTLAIDLENESIPVDDGFFDVVLCGEVIEHMEIDPMYMLGEVNRVTKDSGKLVVTTPNVLSSRGLNKIINGIEPYFYMQYHKTRELHRHNYEYTVPSLAAMLKAAGFLGRIWTEDLFEDGISSAVDKLRLAGVNVTNVGDNILAVVEKTGPVKDRHPVGFYV